MNPNPAQDSSPESESRELREGLPAYSFGALALPEAMQDSWDSWTSWFHLLVEYANDLIYLHDPRGRILYANRRLEDVTGWRREEILGRNILELLAPEFRPDAMVRREGLEPLPEARRYETEVVCRDGSRIPLEVHSTAVTLDGQVVAWQGIARDIRERRQVRARMDAVYETARQVVGILNLDQVLAVIVRHAAQFTNAHTCSLWLLHEDRDALYCAAAQSAPEGITSARIATDSNHPVARAFRARDATIENVASSVAAADPALPPDTVTCACLPLSEGDGNFGVLALTYPWIYGPQPTELALLSIFASHAAAAITNARLFEAQRRKTQEAAAIGQVGMAVAGLDVDAALHITGAYAYDLFEADFTAILVMDDPQRTLLRSAFIAERGRRVTEEQYAERFEIAAHPVLREAISTESTLLIENVAEHPLTRDDRRAQCLGVTTCLIVPMLSRDRVEGVLAVGYASEVHPTEVRIRLAETLAQQAAVAVDNAAMFRALATAKREWEATFDAITDPVCIFSTAGTLLRGNQAAGRLLGTSVGELLGKHYCDLFHGGQEPEEGNVFQECLRSGQPVVRELESLSVPGVYQVSAYPLLDSEGGCVGVVEYIKDITTQREMQARLYHSARLAGVGELASGVVHNFKNVLMGVSGMLDVASMLLERGGSLDEVRERLADAQGHVFRGNQVLQRLLDFARGMAQDVASVGLEGLLSDVVALCKAHPASRGIRIRTELPALLPAVRADAGQLHEVILNLVLNALQAMTAGGIVTISAEVVEERVRIAVSDTGCGIPPEDLERIFEPFFSRRRQGPPGSGIGLSASLRMVKAMGGDLQVQSEVGVGTRFTVELPCAPPEEAQR